MLTAYALSCGGVIRYNVKDVTLNLYREHGVYTVAGFTLKSHVSKQDIYECFYTYGEVVKRFKQLKKEWSK